MLRSHDGLFFRQELRDWPRAQISGRLKLSGKLTGDHGPSSAAEPTACHSKIILL
jgi:hypothetical protein